MRATLAVMLVALSAACESNRGAAERSERERDSVIGASQLPGARAVRGALGAADSAAARRARIDSVAGEP
jgi:hypothetical protein